MPRPRLPLGTLTGIVALLFAQDPAGNAPALLEEPGYIVQKEESHWVLKKPRLQIFETPHVSRQNPPWTIFKDRRRSAVEQRRSALPRIRLNRSLVNFAPLTHHRTVVEDWSAEGDAKEIERDVRDLINRFASPTARELLSRTPLYMALLSGASGHTAEEWNNQSSFVIYVDPFRATGRLHLASTLVHELSHVERYRERGFHANRTAAVLSRADFMLLGVADELSAYQAEAAFIQRLLKSLSDDEAARTRAAMRSALLRWPAALLALLAQQDSPKLVPEEARGQTALDIVNQARRYWTRHNQDALGADLKKTILNWYSESDEWKAIAAQRKHWAKLLDAQNAR